MNLTNGLYSGIIIPVERRVKQAMGQIEAMKKLGLSDAEIAELLASDRRIEKGENPFPLTPEQEKASKEARKADKAPTVYKLDNTDGKRSRKANADKQAIINRLTATIDKFVSPHANPSIEVANPEREFTFTYNGTKYKVVLSAPRS